MCTLSLLNNSSWRGKSLLLCKLFVIPLNNWLVEYRFIVIQQDIDAFYNTVPGFIASGEIKPKEHIIKGLDNARFYFPSFYTLLGLTSYFLDHRENLSWIC